MIITHYNPKGGVGKSTLAAHAAVWLYDHGIRVVACDANPTQATLSRWLSGIEDGPAFLAASNIEDLESAVQQYRQQQADALLIDVPGGNPAISQAAVMLSDLIVVPTGVSPQDISALSNGLKLLKIARATRQGRPEAMIILNLTHKRSVRARDLSDAIPKSLGIPVAKQDIRRLNDIQDAFKLGSVVTRMQTSAAQSAAEDLDQLFNELYGALLAPKTNTPSEEGHHETQLQHRR